MNVVHELPLRRKYLMKMFWLVWIGLAVASSSPAQEPKLQKIFARSDKQIYCLAFSPDGKTLGSGGLDMTVRLWNLATGENTAILHDLGYIRSLVFSPDGSMLASSSTGEQGGITLWDVATQKVAGKNAPSIKSLNSGSFMAFNRDGKLLAWTDNTEVSSTDGKSHKDAHSASLYSTTIKLWDIATSKNTSILSICADEESSSVDVHPIQSGPRITSKGRLRIVMAVAFSPDGKTVAGVDNKGVIELWDVTTRKKTAECSHNDGWSFGACLAFSPDGKTLASGDKTIKLWDPATGKNTTNFRGHNAQVFSLAFSPDGRTLASGGWEKTIKLWDVATGKNIVNLDAGSKAVNCVVFSPDGKTLASADSDGTIKLWNVGTLATGSKMEAGNAHNRR